MQVLNDTKLVSSLKDMTEAEPMGEEPEDGFFVCPEGMSKEQVIKALKDIILSNDFDGKEEQENALIIAIAELLTK